MNRLPPGTESEGLYLRRQYPTGATVRVLYNPQATDDLFQGRTLNISNWSADPAAEERQRVLQWPHRCLLPFAILLSASWLMRQTTTTTRINKT